MGDIKKLGKYTIQSVLGQGAMGIVYKGFDPIIERTVAIKAIRKDAFRKEEMKPVLARFQREAQAAGRLTHPGIVTVYEYGEDGDNAFIAMEYVPGRELDDFLDKKERFSVSTVIDIVTQLLDALIYSHAQGVVHRDIKPENIILLDSGRIKIMDFGIAKIESSTLTQFGDVFGTPSYMSPEQFSGQPVDNRSDLYSTGVILYHLLTGEKPFHGDSITSIMHRVMTTEAPLASDINLQVPSFLDGILQKALAKKPGQRFQSAEEFKAALIQGSTTGETSLEGLYGKTNTELREMCAAAGITGISKKNKKQLIAALQDAGNGGPAVPGTNQPTEEIGVSGQQGDRATGDHPAPPKEYDKTLFEPQEDAVEEAKPKRTGKKLKMVLTLLFAAILAISGFTGWKIYRKDLTTRDLEQIAQKLSDNPASVFAQLLTLARQKAKDISGSVFDLHPPVAIEKPKALPTASPGRSTAVARENPKSVPAPIPEPEPPIVELSQSSKHKSRK
ncbi:MAG: protein kinase [Proteobacteria bacterium]|nr:protein kinase [Pseudomonadota bacterium]MBU1736697.1 protein kinase [Pseudomonadota bacterium]